MDTNTSANGATAESNRGPSSLDDLARRLKSPRVDRAVSGYSESNVSFKRVLAAGVILLWTAVWAYGGIAQPRTSSLATEAHHLMPWISVLFLGSVVWALYIRRLGKPPTPAMEIAGTAGNYVGIGLMLHMGWNVAIAAITFLPLASIVMGARFSRRIFHVAIAGSLVLLGVAAPDGYWVARPAFIPFAIVLLVGLPLTVNRLLNVFYEVSTTAVISRDLQARFLAMISHELRTPLNTLCVGTHLLDAARFDRSDQGLVFSLRANADALLRRINQLLDMAALDNGRLQLSIAPFELRALFDMVGDLTNRTALEKGVELTFSLEPNLPQYFVGDAGRIEQVITNIVGNALKFTPRGGSVTVHVQQKHKDRKTGMSMLRFCVTDTGAGLPEGSEISIFSPFVQANAGEVRRQEGLASDCI